MADNRSPPDSRRSSRARAADDDDADRQTRESWEDEGGSVDERLPRKGRRADRVMSGRIVQAAGAGRRYKVVLTHEDGHKSERPCRTIQEGEAFIRSVAPALPKRDTSRDRAPGQC